MTEGAYDTKPYEPDRGGKKCHHKKRGVVEGWACVTKIASIPRSLQKVFNRKARSGYLMPKASRHIACYAFREEQLRAWRHMARCAVCEEQTKACLLDSPSHLRMLVKTQVVAGMFRPMAKVSVANKHCTTKHKVSNKCKNW